MGDEIRKMKDPPSPQGFVGDVFLSVLADCMIMGRAHELLTYVLLVLTLLSSTEIKAGFPHSNECFRQP